MGKLDSDQFFLNHFIKKKKNLKIHIYLKLECCFVVSLVENDPTQKPALAELKRKEEIPAD